MTCESDMPFVRMYTSTDYELHVDFPRGRTLRAVLVDDYTVRQVGVLGWGISGRTPRDDDFSDVIDVTVYKADDEVSWDIPAEDRDDRVYYDYLQCDFDEFEEDLRRALYYAPSLDKIDDVSRNSCVEQVLWYIAEYADGSEDKWQDAPRYYSLDDFARSRAGDRV